MTKAETIFHQIADGLPSATKSKMFGALCIKARNGKSSAIFWKDSMLFKLSEVDEKKALRTSGARQGAHLYEPDRPMKGWVLVPFIHSSKWKDLAKRSLTYLAQTEPLSS